MSEKGNIENPFSADAIRLYLEGKMSAGQMHALEKAAMDDPFLADAIEGMQIRMQIKTGSFEDDTLDLHQKLYQRVHEESKKNKIIPLFLSWRGAAAILLLAGSVFLSYRFLFHEKSTWRPIAIKENKKMPPPSVVSDDKTAVEVPPASNGPADNIRNTPSKKTTSQKENEDISLTSRPLADTVSLSKDAAKNLNNQSFLEKEDDRQALTDKPIPKPETNSSSRSSKSQSGLDGRASGAAVQSAPAIGSYVFRGRVLNQMRQPVTGASVGFKNKKALVVTDEQGRFRFKTNSSDSIAVVEINSVGYQSASHILSSDSNENLVQLTPSSTSLNEAVVAGYNSKKKPDSTDEYVYDVLPGKHNIRVEKAIPADGWSEYNKYIAKNKKISTGDSVISGDEIVSFSVDSNGKLSEFKIERSISLSHDTEAIRLLRDGPAWKLLRRKKQRTTVTIKF